MIRNNTIFKRIVGFAASVSMVLSMASPAFAAGSLELNEKDSDYRLYTEAFSDGTTAGIERRNSIMCYLKAGETVYFGSSVYNSRLNENYVDQKTETGKDITVKLPNGSLAHYDVIQDGAGHIANPAQERGGPNLTETPDSSKYTPLSFKASEAGVYTFYFHSYTGVRSGNAPGPVKTTNPDWNAKTGTVAAWDITVADSAGNVIEGRTWANYLSVITGGADARCSLHTYVLTDDGVIYQVDLNEIAPNGFVFFANNQGFTDRGIAPKSIYHSFYDTDSSAAMSGMEAENISVHLPNAADSTVAKTFKIFFEEPDEDLLKIIAPTPVKPEPIKNLKFHGITDSVTHVGAGGEFTFETRHASTATLTIDFRDAIQAEIDAGHIASFSGSGIIEITGAVADGTNVFYWDGKDTEGVIIPEGSFEMDKIRISAEPKQGEIHFPLLDVEGMYEGLTIKRLNGGGLTENPDSAYDLYYNNNPLVYGTIEGEGHDPVTSGKHYLLSDGTKQYAIKHPEYFYTSEPKSISTLTSSGHVPVNSSETSMKFKHSGNNGGGNYAGIDIWTYFAPTDSTVSKSLQDVTGETKMIILPAPANTGSISGLVFFDANGNGIYNLNEQDKVLPGVTVQLLASDEMEEVFSKTEVVNGTPVTVTFETTTDIYGTYHFTGVPKGEYIVKTIPGAGKSYICSTNNDGSTPEKCVYIDVTSGKETRNGDVGYETPALSPVSYTFRKAWGSSNPLESVWVKLYKEDSSGMDTYYEEAELSDANNWTCTFLELERGEKYRVAEYYYNGEDEVLLGRSPAFCANDSYWGSSKVYQKDTSSAEERHKNAAPDAKMYDVRFEMYTMDRCNYVITLNNKQTYDSREYYAQLDKELSLDNLLSITGHRTNTVEPIDPAKLVIEPADGNEYFDYEVDPDNDKNLLYLAFETADTRKYKVNYDGVHFELTVHVYDAAADTYNLTGHEIIEGITSGSAVVLQGSGKNLLLGNDKIRLSAAAGCSAQIAGIAYAGNEEVPTPSALEYQSAVAVDNTGKPTSGTYAVSAEGESGTLTLTQTKTSGFPSGAYDTASYAEVSYLPGDSDPTGSKEVYYYKLIVRSPKTKGIGFGLHGETLEASTGVVMYVPVTINYEFPYTVSYDEKGHGIAPETELVPWGEKATKPADPTETGYTFGGWYEAADCSGSPFDFDSVLTGDRVLHAKWILNIYTAAFDVNGGTPVVEDHKVAHGQKLTEPSVSREGYSLAGWDTPDESRWDFSVPVTSDLHLKAMWEPLDGITYRVEHYKENLDGTYSLAKTVYHKGRTEETVHYTAETFTGFTLDLDNDNTVPSGVVHGEGSLVLRLYYTRDSYNINYSYTDHVHGAPAVGSQTVKFEADASLAPDPVLTGYTFNGWTTGDVSVSGGAFKMPAQDVTVHGSWTINTYTVTWKNDDGTTLSAVTYNYGETPVHTVPSKPETAEYTYNFSGWTPEVSAVSADIVYTAQYIAVKNQYDVVFDAQGKSDNPDALRVDYGAKAGAPAEPSADGWVFKGWYDNPEYTGSAYNFAANTVTGNITLYAKWDRATYTITWLDYDGTTVLATTTADHGDTPAYPYGTPSRLPSGTHHYAFYAWSPAITDAHGNATYIALYTERLHEYTITWKNDDGSIFTTTSAFYGTSPSAILSGVGTPAKAEDAENTYTFKGWAPEVVSLTGDTVYTAAYDVHPKKYGVIFEDEEGDVLYSAEYNYGETPVYGGEPHVKEANAEYSYVFSGWTPAISAVTGPAVYKTSFNAVKNKYDITWLGGDKAPAVINLEYGEPIAAPDGFVPEKASDAEFTYRFTGWNPEILSTSIVTHHAEYEPVFEKITNEYTVTWKNYDGTILKTDADIPYGILPHYEGETPVKPSGDTHHYVFTGWSPEVSEVKGNAVYTAVFTDLEKPQPNKPHKPKPVNPAPAETDPADSGISRYLNDVDHFGYIAGYPDGTVRPESKITRAETAALFYSLLWDKEIGDINSFSDVPAGAWYEKYVIALHNIGAINGYNDGTFRPQNNITRAEFTTIAVSFAHAVDKEAGFPDVPSSHWAEGYIAAAAHYGWVTGYPDGTFRPGDTITRAEAITIINCMLDRRADTDYVHKNNHKLRTFSDLKNTAWYYYGIMEAANTHDHTKEHIEIWHD